VLVNFSEPIVRALAAPRHAGADRGARHLRRALQRLEGDATLSRADRMQALIARIDLARIDLPEPVAGKPAPQPKLPSRCSRTCATRRRAPTARSRTATSARR
jgi:hypothetical protein